MNILRCCFTEAFEVRIGNTDAYSSTEIGKPITANDLCYRTANPALYNKGPDSIDRIWA